MRRLLAIAMSALVPLACDEHEDAPPSIAFTISGEDVGRTGFAFPPHGDEPAFVRHMRGWPADVRKHVLTWVREASRLQSEAAAEPPGE